MVGGLGCVGKKTALLQTLVVCRLVRFANVLFCVSAVIFSLSLFQSLSSKLSAVSFFLHLAVTLRLSVAAVRDCGVLSCPPTPKFERCRMLELPLKPLLHIAFVTAWCFLSSIILLSICYSVSVCGAVGKASSLAGFGCV